MKAAPKSQGCLGSGVTCRVIQKEEGRIPHSWLLSPFPEEPWEDAGSLLPKQSGSLAWKVSKDNNPERAGTKTGDNPREI